MYVVMFEKVEREGFFVNLLTVLQTHAHANAHIHTITHTITHVHKPTQINSYTEIQSASKVNFTYHIFENNTFEHDTPYSNSSS